MIEAITRRIAAAVVLALAFLAAGQAGAEPALWTVTGRSNTVWLFGSVHLLPKGGFTIDGALAEALEDAESVCLEVDSSALAPAQTTSLTLARAVDPEGRDLFELLGDDAARARETASAAGIDLEPFAPFEPWFAGLTVSVMALQQQGYDVEHGVEKFIEAAAQETGKGGCGLETLDEQLGMLDSLAPELQRELLLQSIEEAEDVDAVIAPLLAAWRAGDETALSARLEDEFGEYPELAEALIYARNARWAEQLDEFLTGDDDVLVVVGALHLVGERGLPALLEKRGYRVERN
ncbi:MAG: TraB/GumN family protein [Steroidobacteraceae bacterium]